MSGPERVVAVVVVECHVTAAVESPWLPGPLPLTGSDGAEEAAKRSDYFQSRAAKALYEAGPASGRWYRELNDGASPVGSRLLACELLQFPDGSAELNAMMAVHLLIERYDHTAIDALVAVTRLGHEPGPRRAWLEALLGSAGSLGPSGRAFCSVFLHAITQLEPLHGELAQPPDWTAEEQWLFHAAAATPPNRFPPHPSSRPEEIGQREILSASWQALVLRDGAAFLMAPEDEDFAPDAERYFRSIYLDALLMGSVQRLYMQHLANSLANLADPADNVGPLMQLQAEMTRFRNTYWWQHVTGHGPANQLLRAYQTQHRLDDLSQHLFAGLRESVDQAEVAIGRKQTAESQRANALLGLVTILGLPFGVALGLMQVLGTEGWCVGYGMLAAAAVSGLIALAPPARTLLDPLRHLD
jgi:hypothetical protein